ncbi:MAG: glycosyltransferase [Cytophagaceae bacterium]|nr:glycosyltransferase [Cytophagaceae bacterium]
MKIVIIGLSITSSWGNGHATTYRSLLKQLAARGHKITFFEKDMSYYAQNRDMPQPAFCDLILYNSNEELKTNYKHIVSSVDVVIVGSYVQQGVEIGSWVNRVAQGVTAFYDIDTPVTLAKLKKQDYEYLHPELIPQYDLYLSFSGGPILTQLEEKFKSPMARALYCSVDTDLYYPENREPNYQMGYLGTYSPDRQPAVEKLLNKTASIYKEGKFVVAGPQYPNDIKWSTNVERIQHLPPIEHRKFYNSQKYALNITRADMVKAGYSPSVRLFEAAACAVPVISDKWDGIQTFFDPDSEILLADSTQEVLDYFNSISEQDRKQIGKNARQHILNQHSSTVRAYELEKYLHQVMQLSEKS